MDAYNTVIENGTQQGGVSDGGSTWGEVYSTYSGIANARGWTATTTKPSWKGHTFLGWSTDRNASWKFG